MKEFTRYFFTQRRACYCGLLFMGAPLVPHDNKKGASISANPLFLLVGRQGFEPWTNGLKVRCSTS